VALLGGLVVLKREVNAPGNPGDRLAESEVRRGVEHRVPPEDQERPHGPGPEVRDERPERSELVLGVRLDLVGVDDGPTGVREEAVQGVRDRVDFGRLRVPGDHDAAAPVAEKVRRDGARERVRGETSSGLGGAGRSSHADLRRHGPGERFDVPRGERLPVVGAGAGRGHRTLDDVEAVDRPAGGAPAAPCGELPRQARLRRAARQEIRVERQDHVRVRETVDRVDRLAERQPRAVSGVVPRRRLPLVPLRFGERRGEHGELPRQRRRGDRFGQDPQARAAPRPLLFQDEAHLAEKRGPRADLAQLENRPRPVGVVEPVHRGLREDVGPAEARGVERVALDLRGPAHVTLDEETGREPADAHRGRVEERLARDDLLRLADVRNDLFGRLAGARRDAGERERNARELEEVPPVEAIGWRIGMGSRMDRKLFHR
jgi:hypothetical protein